MSQGGGPLLGADRVAWGPASLPTARTTTLPNTTPRPPARATNGPPGVNARQTLNVPGVPKRSESERQCAHARLLQAPAPASTLPVGARRQRAAQEYRPPGGEEILWGRPATGPASHPLTGGAHPLTDISGVVKFSIRRGLLCLLLPTFGTLPRSPLNLLEWLYEAFSRIDHHPDTLSQSKRLVDPFALVHSSSISLCPLVANLSASHGGFTP